MEHGRRSNFKCRCESCDYCKQTKVLEDVEEYEIKEAE